MESSRRLWIALVVGLIAVTGCPSRPPEGGTLPLVTTDDPEAEAEMRAARQAFEAGDAADAAQRFAAFIDAHPDDPLRPVAELGLGRIRLAEGRYAEAKELFDRVAAHRDESLAERGRLYNGVTAHLSGRHAEALELLRPLVGRTVDPEETALLLRTLAAASEAEGDRLGALEALDALVRASVPEEDREEARRRLLALVRAEATPEEIQQTYERLPRQGEAWPHVARRALREAFDAGDMTRVRQIVRALRERNVELEDDLAAMALRAERTGDADARAIGAILPLSGRAREVGQLAMRGLMLGAGMPPTGPIRQDAPQVIFRDDGGDPVRASRAVDDLASLHRVIAIIGPVEGESALAAARRAQELGVPLIALSPADGITEVGPMIFRLFVTPEREVEALALAARARGATRFAVLRPDTPYGIAMRDAFEAELRTRGGELVADATYPADATSFGEPIATLGAARFEALFVPDAGRRLALIAPALAAAGLSSVVAGAAPPQGGRAVLLLAPSVGWDAQLVRRSGRYLQGALFSRPFDPAGEPGAGAFAGEFRTRYGSSPDAYAAYAYDAFSLVRRAVQGGATTREALAAELSARGTAATVGASGGFAANRGPARGTRVFELRGEALAPLN